MDVAETLQLVHQAVKRGAFDEARTIGNRGALPLGISSTDLQLGELLHETPHSMHLQGAV